MKKYIDFNEVTPGEILATVIECIEDKLDSNDFKLDDDFKNDIGFDSLEFIYLILKVEDRLGIKRIDEIELFNINTPNDLIKYICDRI